MRWLMTVMAALLFPTMAMAAEYWVDCDDPNAQDGGPGTEQSPWKTIQYAADTAQPGDVVHVRPGFCMERVWITVSGTEDATITFVSDEPHQAKCYGFTIDGASHVRIEGFEIEGSVNYNNWNERQGFFVKGDHIEIVNNYIHDTYAAAVQGYWHEPYPDSILVQNNRIFHVQQGIIVTGSGWLVQGNEVEKLYDYGNGDCDYMRLFGSNHVVKGNYFHGTVREEIGQSHVDCFQTFSNNGESLEHVWVEGNICFDYHQGFMASNTGGTEMRDITFVNNVFAFGWAWGMAIYDVSEVKVYNNTFAHIEYHGIGFHGNSTGNEVYNNIFFDTGTSVWQDGTEPEVAADYNLVYQSAEPGIDGGHSIIDEAPRFFVPDGTDFRLLQDSPAIDAGTDVPWLTTDIRGKDRPYGDGWDIGAYEYSGEGTDTPSLEVLTDSLPDAVVGEPYSVTLDATGGTPPYAWSVQGDLPPGLTLEATGLLHGVPEEAGTWSFSAWVTDAEGETAYARLSLLVAREGDDPGDSTDASDTDDGDAGNGGGCGCSVPAGRSSRPLTLLGLTVALLLALRRRFR